jgi:phosphatidylglycerophosphate synthase
MDVKEIILRKLADKILPLFKKAGIPAESLTLFRIMFAVITAVVIVLGNFWYALAFLSIYQVIFILDYIDGKLARYQKRFSILWLRVDRVSHYAIALLFFSAVLLSNLTKLTSYSSYIGLFGVLILSILTIIELFSKNFVPSSKKDYTKHYPLYSFIGIDNPFSLFYFFFIFSLAAVNIYFYTFIYLIILLKKLTSKKQCAPV